jgi:hypothetical protein
MAKTILHGERGRLISIKFSKVKIKKEATMKLPPPPRYFYSVILSYTRIFPMHVQKSSL